MRALADAGHCQTDGEGEGGPMQQAKRLFSRALVVVGDREDPADLTLVLVPSQPLNVLKNCDTAEKSSDFSFH